MVVPKKKADETVGFGRSGRPMPQAAERRQGAALSETVATVFYPMAGHGQGRGKSSRRMDTAHNSGLLNIRISNP